MLFLKRTPMRWIYPASWSSPTSVWNAIVANAVRLAIWLSFQTYDHCRIAYTQHFAQDETISATLARGVHSTFCAYDGKDCAEFFRKWDVVSISAPRAAIAKSHDWARGEIGTPFDMKAMILNFILPKWMPIGFGKDKKYSCSGFVASALVGIADALGAGADPRRCTPDDVWRILASEGRHRVVENEFVLEIRRGRGTQNVAAAIDDMDPSLYPEPETVRTC